MNAEETRAEAVRRITEAFGLTEGLLATEFVHWFLCRCHWCDFVMPFRDATERDTWTTEHQLSCKHPVDYWEEDR